MASRKRDAYFARTLLAWNIEAKPMTANSFSLKVKGAPLSGTNMWFRFDHERQVCVMACVSRTATAAKGWVEAKSFEEFCQTLRQWGLPGVPESSAQNQKKIDSVELASRVLFQQRASAATRSSGQEVEHAIA
jgi:hypothetical protein